MKKTVISLVGMVGSGKTTLLNELAQEGYNTLPEEYISEEGHVFDNRLILSQWKWIGSWFEKIVAFFDANKESSYVFVDNSALFSGIKTPRCASLIAPVQACFEELKEMSFDFINIEIYCEKHVLFKRIAERLKKEPVRLQYNEGSREFIDVLYDQFQQYAYLWDYRLDSTDKTPRELKTELVADILRIKLDK